MKKVFTWLRNLSKAEQVVLGFVVLALVGTASAATDNNQAASIKDKPSESTSQTQAKPVITTKTETATESIPFTASTIENGTIAKGTTKITTAGVNGVKTLTYQVTYEDGKQTDKKLIKTEVTTQPIAQVTSVGTYVAPPPPAAPSCPNGTYINSAGNTVCSPYQSPSAPAGATARCVDGTYSFSQSRSGTCSHHGGVAQWL